MVLILIISKAMGGDVTSISHRPQRHLLPPIILLPLPLIAFYVLGPPTINTPIASHRLSNHCKNIPKIFISKEYINNYCESTLMEKNWMELDISIDE